MLWGVGAVAATADGLTEGVKENAEGVSEGGGLEAKEKPTDPEPKGVGAAMENGGGAEEAHVVGTEKLKPDDDAVDVAGAVGTMLNGAAEEAAAGARGVEAANEVKLRFGNVAGADGKVAASLGGWGAKEPVNKKINELSFDLITSWESSVYKQRLHILEVTGLALETGPSSHLSWFSLWHNPC